MTGATHGASVPAPEKRPAAHKSARCWLAFTLMVSCVFVALAPGRAAAADDVFIYSTAANIRSVNLTRGTDVLLTTAPSVGAANALAFNQSAGFVYYGDDTSVYRWDPALGSGAGAHSVMMNFATGPVTAPITALDSTGGSYIDGIYYVGSEDPGTGQILELYALSMSLDGSQVVSADALGILAACGCTSIDLGGFGDIAAFEEGGATVIYGSSSPLAGGGGGFAGRWRYVPSTQSFTFLASSANGQLSRSVDNRLYSNVGNDVREVDKVTGATSPTTLLTTSSAIFDFTSGFVMDFGDAPDSYGAAFHVQSGSVSTTFIGATGPDNDSGSMNAVSGFTNGAGDDSDGSDDEDAVETAAIVSLASGSYAVTVSCTAGTRVAGWVDFNIDGSFKSNERNDNHPASCSGGSVTLSWDSLPGASAGNSYLRLRASTNLAAISSPVGVATDGEVEDHPVVIDAPSFGSCPVGSVSAVYTPNDLPLAIPVGTVSASSILNVPDDTIITDVNVLGLEGTHSWINDLQFRLSHGGVTRTLYGYACGSQNDFSMSLDDEGNGTSGCPPTGGGTYPPVQSLDAFDGQSSNGDWELTVTDQYVSADGGTVESWSLEICSAVDFDTTPSIRLGKAALVNGRDVTVTLVAENIGDVALDSVQISDELDPVFGTGTYTVTGAPELLEGPAGMAVNPNWTGVAPEAGLLAAGGELAIGERVELRFTVRVNSFAAAPWGEYENSATVTAAEAGNGSGAGDVVTDISNNDLDLSIDGDAPTPIVVEATAVLSGHVFNDTADDELLAHDGVMASNEAGVGGRVIDAHDNAGGVIASAVTDADGVWTLQIPVSESQGVVTVSLRQAAGSSAVSEAPAYSTGPVADGEVTLIPGIGGEIEGIDFGVVESPQFDADRHSSVADGSVAVLSHLYQAPSFGQLNVSVSPVGTAPGVPRVVLDADCNGAIGTGESDVPQGLAVASGDAFCLLFEVLIPAGTQPGLAFAYQLDTSLALSDANNSGHGVSLVVSNRDTLTILSAGTGRLELDKTVVNLSRAELPGVSNTALPGETLEFVLTYRNVGTAGLQDLVVNDTAPPYTIVVPGTAACEATPVGMSCSPNETGNALDWAFGGDLPPGQSGSVSYRVTID